MTEDEFENEIYFRRLESGLFTLQLIDYIIIEICTNGPPTIKQRVTHILNLRGGSLKTIRQIMRGTIFKNRIYLFHESGSHDLWPLLLIDKFSFIMARVLYERTSLKVEISKNVIPCDFKIHYVGLQFFSPS